MRVWLVRFEETLPIDPSPRLYRMGMAANALRAAGHNVVWWTSTFDCRIHRLRYTSDKVVDVDSGFQIRLLHLGSGHSRAVSVKRALVGLRQAIRLRANVSSAAKPDIILCAMPAPELARMSVTLGNLYKVPVLIDARDMWPDVFADLFSPIKRMLITPYIVAMRMVLRSAARKATGCIGITEPYLDWILGYAGRPQSAMDGVFPLGYTEPKVDAKDVADAEKDLAAKVPDLNNLDVFKVLFLGRLNRTVWDAFEPVLEAASRLRNNSRPFQFLFAGAGDCAEELKKRAQKHPEIIFLGHLGISQMAVLKSRAHVALLCIARRRDYQISLSNKIFEYLSAGLPLASHLTGIVGDLVTTEQCGFIYENGEELAAKLDDLAKDESQRKALGQKARSVFLEKFDAAQIYPKMVHHLEHVVSAEKAKQRQSN